MAGSPVAPFHPRAIRLSLKTNVIGINAQRFAPEAVQLGRVLVDVILNPESHGFAREPDEPRCSELEYCEVRVGDRDAVAIALVPSAM